MIRHRVRFVFAGVASIAIGVALFAAIGSRPAPSVSIPLLVRDSLPASGVSHDVTAVLLNFRSYDTLLEVAVLMAAAIIALALRDETLTQRPARVQYVALNELVWRLVPLLVLVAAYLLWIGSKYPGGAFQAGSILAGAGVLLRLSGIKTVPVDHHIASRLSMTFGLIIFLGVALLTLLTEGALLDYPADWSGTLILMIETALTISIGVVLYSLFDNAPRVRATTPDDHRADDPNNVERQRGAAS